MSVIAKMAVRSNLHFGASKLIDAGCVYDSDLSHKDNENYRFTQATPNGEAKLYSEHLLPLAQGEDFYVLFSRGERPNLEGAIGACAARVVSITDYGGTSKQVEITNSYKDAGFPSPLRIHSCNFKLTIDNVHASVQFEPGKEDYWVRIYPAKDHTMAEVLVLAGKREAATAEVEEQVDELESAG